MPAAARPRPPRLFNPSTSIDATDTKHAPLRYSRPLPSSCTLNGATPSPPSFASNGSSRPSSPIPACGSDRARPATICLTNLLMPPSPPTPSAAIGTSKIARTMCAMSHWARMPPAFEPTPESSRDSVASPPTSYASTRSDPSDRTDTPPPSADIKPSPSCALIERTEQPWERSRRRPTIPTSSPIMKAA